MSKKLSETSQMNNNPNNVLINSWQNKMMRNLVKNNSLINSQTNAFSTFTNAGTKTYFLKGTDTRQLNEPQMEELIQSFVNSDPKGQSFLVYNSHETMRKLNAWKTQLPWIQPFYALKSNPIEPLARDLTTNGAGLDVASQGEIKRGMELGVSPSNMIYSNSVKEEKDIIFAAKNGVHYTTADTFDEVMKVHQLAPEMKILWRISIPEDNSQQLSTVFSNKFGDDIISLEDAHLKFKYVAEEIGVKLYGIHFHCGSGKNGSSSFLKAVSMARKCIEIGREYGHPMEILDLGGGYPAGDLNEKFTSALLDTCNDPLGYRVIAEPGRHFSSQTCYLFARIMAKRVKQGRTCYHINDSLYHSFNCVLMDCVSFENDMEQFYKVANNTTLEKNEVSRETLIQGSLFGMTCDGQDVIAKNMGLPKDLQVGDWLCFNGMGSYTFGPKSAFNGMESTTRIFEWDSPIGVAEKPKEKKIQKESQQEPPFVWKPKLIPEPAF